MNLPMFPLEKRNSNNQRQKEPPEVFYKKGVLRYLTKFTRKHLCQSLIFNKVAGIRPATVLKKRLWHRCFHVNFAKFPRTPLLQNTSGRLLLQRKLNCKYSVLLEFESTIYELRASELRVSPSASCESIRLHVASQ